MTDQAQVIPGAVPASTEPVVGPAVAPAPGVPKKRGRPVGWRKPVDGKAKSKVKPAKATKRGRPAKAAKTAKVTATMLYAQAGTKSGPGWSYTEQPFKLDAKTVAEAEIEAPKVLVKTGKVEAGKPVQIRVLALQDLFTYTMRLEPTSTIQRG